ncbi:MAG TPA: hypothetical protein VED40_15410 [Azospirillaceae bacterium]|nr:hypothetical protein [Azospirillaceae bacterium]
MRVLPVLLLPLLLAACTGTAPRETVAENPAFSGCVRSVKASTSQENRPAERAAELAACLDQRA